MPPRTEFVKFLGQGVFGSVDLVKYITTDDGSSPPLYAAVKTAESDDYEYLEREVHILSKLKGCQGIVQCYENYELQEGFDRNGSQIYMMVMEYADAGDLYTLMESYKDKKLPEKMIIDFTRMILEGLVSIHSLGYVHCDIKPENVLVFSSTHSYELKISDFGSSEEVGEIGEAWDVDCPFLGTPIYMSPESVHNGVAQKGLDLWSLGCVVLEMYTGMEPWCEVGYDDIATCLRDLKAPQIPQNLPCDARNFLKTCFARNPEDRGTVSGLLLHRFLNEDEVYNLQRLFASFEVGDEDQTSEDEAVT